MGVLRSATGVANNALTQYKNAIDAGGAAGKARIYSGTIPSSPDVAPTGVLLAELVLSYPCGNVSGKTLTLSSITQDSSADSTGTAGYVRMIDSAGNAVIDGNVTATGGGGVLQLNTTSIVAGGPVAISSFALSIP